MFIAHLPRRLQQHQFNFSTTSFVCVHGSSIGGAQAAGPKSNVFLWEGVSVCLLLFFGIRIRRQIIRTSEKEKRRKCCAGALNSPLDQNLQMHGIKKQWGRRLQRQRQPRRANTQRINVVLVQRCRVRQGERSRWKQHALANINLWTARRKGKAECRALCHPMTRHGQILLQLEQSEKREKKNVETSKDEPKAPIYSLKVIIVSVSCALYTNSLHSYLLLCGSNDKVEKRFDRKTNRIM